MYTFCHGTLEPPNPAFNLFYLEDGEYIISSVVATLKKGYNRIEGTLRLCTHSIIFQPDLKTEPLTKILHNLSSQMCLNKSTLSLDRGSKLANADPKVSQSDIQVAISSPKSRQKEANYFSMKCLRNDISKWASIPLFKYISSKRDSNQKVEKINAKSNSIIKVNLTARENYNKNSAKTTAKKQKPVKAKSNAITIKSDLLSIEYTDSEIIGRNPYGQTERRLAKIESEFEISDISAVPKINEYSKKFWNIDVGMEAVEEYIQSLYVEFCSKNEWVSKKALFKQKVKLARIEGEVSGIFIVSKERNFSFIPLFNSIGDEGFEYKLSDIRAIFKKGYLPEKRCIEIFLLTRKSHLISFSSTESMNSAYDYILNNAKNIDHMILNQEKVTDMWVNNKISNYEYLLYINHFSGRSFHDLSQYPIFPWVVKDYTSESLIPENKAIFRDLSKSVAEQFQKKKKAFLDIEYKIDLNPSSFSCCSGSIIILSYLVRKSPAFLYKLKSLSQNRYLISIAKYWADVEKGIETGEAIPEFYSIENCDFLINKHNINFRMLYSGTPINDVILPKCCTGSIDFAKKMSYCLESPLVGAEIHKWINTHFNCNHMPLTGNKQSVSREQSSISDPDLDVKSFGVYSTKLWEAPHPCKLINDPICFKEIDNLCELFYQATVDYQKDMADKTRKIRELNDEYQNKKDLFKKSSIEQSEKYREALRKIWMKNETLAKEFYALEAKKTQYYKSVIQQKDEEHRKELKKSISKNFGLQQAKELETKIIKYKIEEKSQLTLMEALMQTNSNLKKKNSQLEKQIKQMKENSGQIPPENRNHI